MSSGVIGRPPDVAAFRRDFDEFVTELESRPLETVAVVFGCGWGNELYPADWLELNLTGSELRLRVAEAETAGLGKIGEDDLFIKLPGLGVERLYCHEVDIHLTADADHPYVEAERQEWIKRGWDVYPCAGVDAL